MRTITPNMCSPDNDWDSPLGLLDVAVTFSCTTLFNFSIESLNLDANSDSNFARSSGPISLYLSLNSSIFLFRLSARYRPSSVSKISFNACVDVVRSGAGNPANMSSLSIQSRTTTNNDSVMVSFYVDLINSWQNSHPTLQELSSGPLTCRPKHTLIPTLSREWFEASQSSPRHTISLHSRTQLYSESQSVVFSSVGVPNATQRPTQYLITVWFKRGAISRVLFPPSIPKWTAAAKWAAPTQIVPQSHLLSIIGDRAKQVR